MKKSIYTAEFRHELIRAFREQTDSQTAFAHKWSESEDIWKLATSGSAESSSA